MVPVQEPEEGSPGHVLRHDCLHDNRFCLVRRFGLIFAAACPANKWAIYKQRGGWREELRIVTTGTSTGPFTSMIVSGKNSEY